MINGVKTIGKISEMNYGIIYNTFLINCVSYENNKQQNTKDM